MTYFLSNLPLWVLIVAIVVVPTFVAMVLQALIHRWVGVDRLVKNNEIAGFKFATVGVIYAVLLAFTVIAVWEKFSAAEAAVDQEAASIAALLRYAEGAEPEAFRLRTAIAHYGKTAVESEWSAMAKESESLETTEALNEVYEAALALNRIATRDTADMSEVFTQIDHITASRRLRLHLATGLVPSVVWISLFAGAKSDRGLHIVLRQRESDGPDADDGNPQRASLTWTCGDHIDRPPLHRSRPHRAGPDRARARRLSFALSFHLHWTGRVSRSPATTDPASPVRPMRRPDRGSRGSFPRGPRHIRRP